MLFKCNWNVEQAADEYWGTERYVLYLSVFVLSTCGCSIRETLVPDVEQVDEAKIRSWFEQYAGRDR
jgi:hypothetical protein